MTSADVSIAALVQAAEAQSARGQKRAAITLLEEALRLDPDHVPTLISMAVMLLADDPKAAEAAARRAAELEPKNARAWNIVGQSASAQQRGDAAVAAFEAAVRAAPADPGSLSNLAVARLRAGDPHGAVRAANQAAGLAPRMPEAHANYGHACLALERNEDAVEAFVNALAIKPDFADALVGMARALRNLGRASQAIAALRRIREFDPAATLGLSDLAALWEEVGEHDLSLRTLKEAIAAPNAPAHLDSNLLFAAQYSPAADELVMAKAARDWGLREVARSRIVRSRPRREVSGRRLHIGYVSADLYRHPVGWLGMGAIRNHDRSRFEVFIYANQTRWDETTRALQQTVDAWRPMLGVSDDEAAQSIADDEIDVLVDLSGHTQGNRLGVFARRPARAQISWLGYFATTGLPTMDYVLLDDAHVSPGGERFFSEDILRMPVSRFCYSAPDYASDPAPPPCLKAKRITFGSFNHSAKINEAVIDLWTRVLAAVPASDLLLKSRSFADPWLQARIRGRFVEKGIDSGRIRFDGLTSHQVMFRQYGQVDIALDPFPFGGGLTSCEALWMGVPVVTFPGRRPVSRQTLSVLGAFNRTEFVASTEDEYIAIAKDLTNAPERLADLRSRLRVEMASSRLCDAKAFASDLEQIYQTII